MKNFDITYFAWKKTLNEKENNGYSLAEQRFDERFGNIEKTGGLNTKMEVKVEPMEISQNK